MVLPPPFLYGGGAPTQGEASHLIQERERGLERGKDQDASHFVFSPSTRASMVAPRRRMTGKRHRGYRRVRWLNQLDGEAKCERGGADPMVSFVKGS